MRKIVLSIIVSILILGSLGLTQLAFTDLSGSGFPSVPDSFDLASPSVENFDALTASFVGSFESIGADVDTNLGGFEPHVAVNPFNSANVVVSQGINLKISADSGATFPITVTAVKPASLTGTYSSCGDSVVTFDSQGRLFWTHLACKFAGLNLQDLSVTVMQVNPTTGVVITAVDVTPGNFIDDKPWIAADANPSSPFADNLYAVWTHFPSPVTVLYSMSTNQGVTWTAPQAISLTGTEGFTWPPHVAVAPNGDVYANYPTDTCGGTGTVQVLRDTNGGTQLAAGTGFQKTAAFTSQQATVTCNVQTNPGTIPQTDFWLQGSAAAYTITDPLIAGRIYVVGNDDPNNIFGNGDDGDVVMVTSTNSGVTWGAVSTISHAPAGTLQVMPTAAIDSLGNIMVSWYDTRAGLTNPGGNLLLDLYATVSTNGGVTFTNDIQINDVAFDPDLNAPARLNGPPPTLRIGEYNGIAAANCLGYAAWTGNDAMSPFNQEIFFDTFSCPVVLIGGEGLPIDTTALLIAGLQINAIWMIPTVLGLAGAGIIIFKLKKKIT